MKAIELHREVDAADQEDEEDPDREHDQDRALPSHGLEVGGGGEVRSWRSSSDAEDDEEEEGPDLGAPRRAPPIVAAMPRGSPFGSGAATSVASRLI